MGSLTAAFARWKRDAMIEYPTGVDSGRVHENSEDNDLGLASVFKPLFSLLFSCGDFSGPAYLEHRTACLTRLGLA